MVMIKRWIDHSRRMDGFDGIVSASWEVTRYYTTESLPASQPAPSPSEYLRSAHRPAQFVQNHIHLIDKSRTPILNSRQSTLSVSIHS